MKQVKSSGLKTFAAISLLVVACAGFAPHVFAASGAQTIESPPPSGSGRLDSGVSQPLVVSKKDPVYSADAQAAQIQGTVVVKLIVEADGSQSHITVARPLGFGLDEKAVEAVQRWKFKPGMKDGKPVAVTASIEVNFILGPVQRHSTTNPREIGDRYLEGEVVRRDERAALRWYTKAAQQADTIAQVKAGLMLEAGKGSPKDYPQAVKWFREAAIAGQETGQARLAALSADGHGTEKNLLVAYVWADLAAAQGSVEGARLKEKLSHQLSSSEIAVSRLAVQKWRLGADAGALVLSPGASSN